MENNENKVKIKVELDTQSLQGVGKAIGNAVSGSTADLQRLGQEFKARRQELQDLAKQAGVSFGDITKAQTALARQERDAIRASQAQAREAARASRQRILEGDRAAAAAKKAADVEVREAKRASKERIAEYKRVAREQEREATANARRIREIERAAERQRKIADREAAAKQVFKGVSPELTGGVLGRAVGGGFFGGGGGVIGGLLGSAGGGGAFGAAYLSGLSVPLLGAITAAIYAMIKAINLAADATKFLISNWLEYRQAIDRATVGFTVFLGSTERARQFIQGLLSDIGGLADTDAVLSLARRLAAVGFEAGRVRDIVKDITKIQLGVGLDDNEVKRVGKALGDVAAAGKLRAQEVNQFTNVGLNIQKIVGDSLGLTRAQVQKLQKDGKISADIVFKAFKSEAAKYDNVFEQALSLPENSARRIQIQLAKLTDQIFGDVYTRVTKVFRQIADEVGKSNSLGEALLRSAGPMADIAGQIVGELVTQLTIRLADPDTYLRLFTASVVLSLAITRGFEAGIAKGAGKAIGALGDRIVKLAINPGQSIGDFFTGANKDREKTLQELRGRGLDGEVVTADQIFNSGKGLPGGGLNPPPPAETEEKKNKGRREKTIFDRLRDAEKNLRSFENVNTKEFTARFKLEGIERTIKDYEKILSLRYELGLPLDVKLPKGKENIEAEVERLESQVRVRDAIKKVTQEVSRAEEERLIALKTQGAPVVEAQTIFETDYAKSLRNTRQEAEKTSAELALLAQKRVDLATNPEEGTRRFIESRKRVFTDILKQAEEAQKQFEDALTTRKAFDTNENILDTVERLGVALQEAGTAGGDSFKIVTREIGFASTYLDSKLLPEIAKLKLETIDLTAEIGVLAAREARYGDVAETARLRSLRLTRALKEDTIGLREEIEAAEIQQQVLLQRLREYDSENGQGRATQQNANNAVLEARIAERDQIIQLETQIATASEGSAERYRIAWLQAIKGVQDAEEEAVKRRIQAQVQIDEQTKFSTERVKAAVAEAAASSRGFTEIFSDNYIAVMQGVGDKVTSLLERATSKLGAFGKAISNIAGDLLRMVTNRLMMRLLDALLGGTSIGSSAGGRSLSINNIGGGLLGSIGGVLNRGAQQQANIGGFGQLIQGGLGTFTTGGFAGGRGAAAVIGTGAAASGGINAFRTPNFNPNSPGGFQTGVSLLNPFETFSGRAAAEQAISKATGSAGAAASSAGSAASTAAAGAGSFKGFFSGFGKQLGAAAPFLGFSLGAGLGGQSAAGQLFGGAGGALLGGTAAGALGALGPAATAFFTNPFTIGIGAALLVGGLLFGRAKQRRQDEQTVDTYWVEYKDTLIQLTNAVKKDQIEGDEALIQASQARQLAVDKINTIKTKSVRESRLKNQMSDVDRLFLEPLKKAVEEQKKRVTNVEENNKRDDRLIPEFATGGIKRGDGYAYLHDREIIVNRSQQTPELVAAAANAGVPGVSQPALKPAPQGDGIGNIEITFVMGTEAQDQLLVRGIGRKNPRAALNAFLGRRSKYDD